MKSSLMPDPKTYALELWPLGYEDGRGWLVTFPDLPGCMSEGGTIEEAIENGKGAFTFWMGNNMEFGDSIPQPAWPAIFVVNIHSPVHMKEALKAWTNTRGFGRNDLALELIAQGLGRAERKP